MALVSVPEKTLEHWSSQYVTYRYRSRASLWWPTNGQDIDVGWLPTRPGKALQLELKTTKVAGADFHDVLIDLGQLWDYRTRSPGRQPFYVFPWPDWRGDLSTAAIASGMPVTELAFARSADWWFADWMVVLTTRQVATILHADLKAHGCRTRGPKARLVRFDLRRPTATPTSSGVTWGPGVAAPTVVPWRDLWTSIEGCGRRGWPQLIRLPPGVLALDADGYARRDLLELLRQAATWEDEGELVTLEPLEDGRYHVAPHLADNLGPSDDETPESEDRRLLVFLDARAIGQH